ncbi:restriction endonuclease [Lactobacillus sanfranciscensis]|uniref:hypothetical protein n=1 Tax=Fructilactobacillus sanfranciscensis TaxID=1625 RepID=UPI00030471E2|nr:hypothetical protein [Fructilactobacillus sanfranciscensis]NDR76477.1 restriction endonuclease [Fructilactobacillus sanfranciscensis]NDR96803.1 restriction endonuclease [Fructilactobacillus sanfranciscensis]NDS05015.1 restriction endonuclease [Fructilactobacillus sanfranciscensis]POH18635.1 restriction endonuclease [Fructilactobacillus sanfranciscensis]POH21838.1 restriction endonuclease [Fructilactobacillus sanfranciscensis]
MSKNININNNDIKDENFRESMPEILDILLIDRTTSTKNKTKNIIWANNNYTKFGRDYSSQKQIKPEMITGNFEDLIMPRALKNNNLQKKRTKAIAEVFTPTKIVKKQNNEIDKGFKNDDIESYVSRLWMEITCGEAPYIASRYDMESGKLIPLKKRVGFLDKKLRRISSEIDDKNVWSSLVEKSFKSSYGFEWNGDSLLLARENLLYTYYDYYTDKWDDVPSYELLKKIAVIISYNIFQMDGLKFIIPLSEKRIKVDNVQLSLFGEEFVEKKWITKPGKRVKIMNWEKNKMEFFDKGVNL